MTSRLAPLIWLAIALACGTALAQETSKAAIRWAPDLPAARRAAAQYGVPVLVHFYGDNCLPCKVLEQQVLSKNEVIETLNTLFICVRINASQQRQLAAEYGVHSWPTDVFLGPDGKVLNQGVCKQNAGEYLGVLRNIAVMNRDRNTMLAAEQSAGAQQVTAQTMAYAEKPVNSAEQFNAQSGPQVAGPQAAGQAAPGPAQPGGIAASHLPNAGSLAPMHPSGPNFYTQGVGSGNQQLPGSLTPNAGVSGGPMQSQNQPHAITTATNPAGSQIAAASVPHAFENSGQLASSNTAGRIPPATPWPNASTGVAAMAEMPSIPLRESAPNAANSAWTGSPVVGAQTVDNPHFAMAPSAATQQPAAVEQQVAQTPPAAPSAAGGLHYPSLQYPADRAYPASLTAHPSPAGNQKVTANTASFQPRHQAVATAPDNTGGNQTPAVAAPAIDGYCPIALKQQGAWVKGQASFAVRHRGQVYWMSDQAAMDNFLANPDQSSPVLSGYDAMAFLTDGKLVPGSIQYGLLEQNSGTILLFSSAENKAAYERDFDRYTKALDLVLQSAGVKQAH